MGQTFKRAVERDYIMKNPITFEEARKPKSSKKSTKVEALTIDEEKKLIQALSNETTIYKPLILLMLFTGMRIGEVLALKWNCIKDDSINIKLTQEIPYRDEEFREAIIKKTDDDSQKTEK